LCLGILIRLRQACARVLPSSRCVVRAVFVARIGVLIPVEAVVVLYTAVVGVGTVDKAVPCAVEAGTEALAVEEHSRRTCAVASSAVVAPAVDMTVGSRPGTCCDGVAEHPLSTSSSRSSSCDSGARRRRQ